MCTPYDNRMRFSIPNWANPYNAPVIPKDGVYHTVGGKFGNFNKQDPYPPFDYYCPSRSGQCYRLTYMNPHIKQQKCKRQRCVPKTRSGILSDANDIIAYSYGRSFQTYCH